MPELPEVETVRRTLKNLIVGKKITKVIAFYDGIIKKPEPKIFMQKIQNQTFRDIRRFGKYLLMDLDDYTLVSHLRMEGKYFIRNSLDELTKHEHVVFLLDNSQYLAYHDVRKFGTMELVELHHEQDLKGLKIMGREIPDPLLDTDYLYEKVRSSSKAIKSILLDQQVISGLGNIYVDECLFLARVNPVTAGKNLDYYQVEKILKSAKAVIDKAIKLGGTTIRTYQSSLGVDGRFQNELNVHTLVNHPCKVCGDTILKTKVGGRGTYYCPTCQRNEDLLIIGLTGGIASGKSKVSEIFQKNAVKVLDADKIYKNLLKTNKIMYNEIVENFGEIVVKDNSINRVELAKIVFSNKEKRELLNQITHPFVIEQIKNEMDKLLHNGIKTVVMDVPLLYEAKMEHLTNFVILVYTSKAVQLERLMKRDQINKDAALAKIQAQMDLEDKKYLADVVIDNSQSIEQTQKQTMEIIDRLRSEGYVI